MKLKSIIFLLLSNLILPAVFGAPKNYLLNPEKSIISFDAHSTLHPVHGTVKAIQPVRIVFDLEQEASPLDAEVLIPVTAFNTGNKRRDEAMYRMFFNDIYPSVKWTAQQMSCFSESEKLWVCQQSGVMDMHGVRKKMRISLRLSKENDFLRVFGDMPIRLSDFNLKPPSVLGLVKVSNEVQVHVNLLWKTESA